MLLCGAYTATCKTLVCGAWQRALLTFLTPDISPVLCRVCTNHWPPTWMHSLDPVWPNDANFHNRRETQNGTQCCHLEVMRTYTDLSSQDFPMMTSSTFACPSGVEGGAPLHPSRNIFMYKLVPPTIMGSFCFK